MERAAVIVAGGQGSRMQSDIPKQFLKLAGKPLLIHTLEAFYQYDTSLPIYLVLPDTERKRWQVLCQQYSCSIAHQVVSGGISRANSVKNGVVQIPNLDCIVGIHDGARPLVSSKIIDHGFKVAEETGSAITSVRLKDSIREVVGESSLACDRSNYRLMQTPQTFLKSWLLEAYDKLSESDPRAIGKFSDEASLVEAVGKQVTLVDGDYHNIKVTTPEDLLIAEAFLSLKASH